jgi:hypothetical protein
MDKKSKTYLTLGLMVLGGGLIYFLATNVVPRMFVTLTKAAPATIVSLNDSYVLGERILAKADGADKCVVNVFIMDASGKGVAGKGVSLTGIDGISPEVRATDKDGKASFNIVSSEEGTFPLEATVDGAPVGRSVRVTFRN